MGGAGVGIRLLNEECPPGTDPFGPDNPIILTVGPLVGLFPLASKTVAMFKSPHTGNLGESHAGGRSAVAIRMAGYGAIVIRGRSAMPVYLVDRWRPGLLPRRIGAVGPAQQLHRRLGAARARERLRRAHHPAHWPGRREDGHLCRRHRRDLPALWPAGAGSRLWQQTAQGAGHRRAALAARRRPEGIPQPSTTSCSRPPPNRR